MKRLFLFILVFSIAISVYSQKDTTVSNIKTGWKFGIALPAIAFDSDIGFKYGALVSFYDYGDGSSFPDYEKSLYAEWSRTTKGSGINKVMFDDKKFFGTNIRFVGDFSYYIEQSLDFYGYNGYETLYNHEFEDITSANYLTRMYYRMDRRLFRVVTDFQIPIIENKLKAVAGYSFYSFNLNSVDIEKMNEDKADADKLPTVDVQPGLYENYIAWGIIPQDQKDGGIVNHFKVGVLWDSRDFEACPTKGIWTEAFFIYSAPLFGNNYDYTQFNFTHRQYVDLYKKRLIFAYRVSYNAKLSGDIPFYMLPYYQNTTEVRDGFGGAKTIRGILRNRLVGDGVAFGNVELRGKVLETKLFQKIDFYIALSAFADAGMVTQKYKFTQTSGTPVFHTDEALHIGYGGGIRFGINQNSIVAVDYGLANDKEDGSSGIYISLNWLF